MCCLGEEELRKALEEAHSMVCRAHQSSPKYFQIKIMRYYWPTILKKCIEYAKKCQEFQFYGNLIHQLLELLHPTIASGPFNTWGLDVVRPLLKSSGGHLYILVAMDYFFKWIETAVLKKVKKESMVDFIRADIIY